MKTDQLAKFVASRTSAKNCLKDGESKSFDMVVRISGNVEKGQSEEYIPTGEIFTTAAIVKALSIMGVQIPNFMRHLAKVAATAIKENGSVSDAILSDIEKNEAKDLKRYVELINEFLLVMPKKTRQAKTTVESDFEVLSDNRNDSDDIDALAFLRDTTEVKSILNRINSDWDADGLPAESATVEA